MEVDLPVWTIRPNWKGGVLERLEWLTDVMASDTGVEQRRAVRLSPRRSFEITVNPTRDDRTYLDLVLHRLGSREWLFPLWHDQAKLEDAALANAARLAIDNTFREYRDGDYAILYLSTFEWEVVQIATQDATGLNLAALGRSAKAWPRGTKVYPLRRATIQTDTSLKALTSRVGESVVLFQLNEANDYAEGYGDAMVLYDGAPLLTLEPNRSQEITLAHTRLYDEADGELGLRYRTDAAGRAFGVQSHNWMIQGREAHSAFRSFLYSLRGRQRMVWLPSFNDDLFPVAALAAGAQTVDIEKVGLSYVGGGSPIPGRARVWTGKEVALIAAVTALPGGKRERVALSAPLAHEYAPGASWGFLDAYRLDQDTIELHHHTDSDGTMECAAGFKAFANVRDGTGSNFVPMPEAIKDTTQCGAPIGANPCRYVPFNGIYMSVTLFAPNPCNPCWDGNRSVVIQETQPNGPGGRSIGDWNFYGGGCDPFVSEVHEYGEPGGPNPRLQGQLLMKLTHNNFNSWTWDFYFPCVFDHVYYFPSARYCGSAGKDEGNLACSVTYADGTTTTYGPAYAAGISVTILGNGG